MIKKEKNPYICVFLSYWKNFEGTEKRVRIIHSKRAIRVRAIELILYSYSAAADDSVNEERRHWSDFEHQWTIFSSCGSGNTTSSKNEDLVVYISESLHHQSVTNTTAMRTAI